MVMKEKNGNLFAIIHDKSPSNLIVKIKTKHANQNSPKIKIKISMNMRKAQNHILKNQQNNKLEKHRPQETQLRGIVDIRFCT